MLITGLKGKIAYATITQLDLFYEGSITVDEDWLDQSNILPFEQVHVVNLSNGERLVTYTIPGERGTGIIGLNGPAARKALAGDQVHILAYAQLDPETEKINPVVLDLKKEGRS